MSKTWTGNAEKAKDGGLKWLRNASQFTRLGIVTNTDFLGVAVDDKAETLSLWHFHRLAPWEARQFALALNAAAEHLDPGGSAEPSEVKS